jgi:hypothetical protein
MNRVSLGPALLSGFAISFWATGGSAFGQATPVAAATLNVPAHYATIQSAIDAAAPGDTVQISSGTYYEQLRIDRDINIVGAGMDVTTIRAPHVLRRGELREASIVEIFSGARVSMSQLTVSGPGFGTCKKGALKAGIRVLQNAHLDFRLGAVRNVHDSPLAACFRSGDGILVGQVTGPPASLNIDRSEITRYQTSGIVVLGFGSKGTITRNIVTGPGHAGGVATDGIELVVGAVGTVSHNTVSGNVCPVGDATCGPDWFTQFQHAGILAGGAGPGTFVTNNLAFGNQVGILLSEADRISDNRMVDNEFFGLGLVDGTFVIEGGQIKGGGGGLWAVAQGANVNVLLRDVTFTKLSGPDVAKVECCGFTATISIAP